MTISFKCPGCGGICAFHDNCASSRARCTRCNQLFIIPSRNDEKAQKVKIELQYDDPLPGFYRAVLKNSWITSCNQKNVTGLIFVALLVCLKFLWRHENCDMWIAHVRLYLPLGWLFALVMLGCLFWYYMEVIYSTAFGTEELPDVYMGTLVTIVGKAVSSLYKFFIALLIVQTPFLAAAYVLAKLQMSVPWLLYALAAGGLFIFPAAVLTVAIGRDLSMLARPDYLIRPITKAFGAYLVPAGMVITAAFIQWKTFGYGLMPGREWTITARYLTADLASVFFAIIAMRTVGLFYRHYSCYMTW